MVRILRVLPLVVALAGLAVVGVGALHDYQRHYGIYGDYCSPCEGPGRVVVVPGFPSPPTTFDAVGGVLAAVGVAGTALVRRHPA